MTSVLHFKPDLALAMFEERMRRQVLTGAVQGKDHFFGIFNYGSYVRLPLDLWIESKAQEVLKAKSILST